MEGGSAEGLGARLRNLLFPFRHSLIANSFHSTLHTHNNSLSSPTSSSGLIPIQCAITFHMGLFSMTILKQLSSTALREGSQLTSQRPARFKLSRFIVPQISREATGSQCRQLFCQPLPLIIGPASVHLPASSLLPRLQFHAPTSASISS